MRLRKVERVTNVRHLLLYRGRIDSGYINAVDPILVIQVADRIINTVILGTIQVAVLRMSLPRF